MSGKVIVVAAVGTGVGKTHFAAALSRVWGSARSVAAFKPVETGTTRDAPREGDDADILERASTFHVKHSERGQRFTTPVAANLAARIEARAVDVPRILKQTRELAAHADVVLVEMAGGLFSPLSDEMLNVDLARALGPDATVLLAQNRLGVLHDVIATLRAAAPLELMPVLIAAETDDASCLHNAAELERITGRRPLGPLPRASREALASSPELRRVAEALAATVGLDRP